VLEGRRGDVHRGSPYTISKVPDKTATMPAELCPLPYGQGEVLR